MPAFSPESTRFWRKVNKTNTCWLWTAGRFGRDQEYGCFYLTGGRIAIGAHIWSYVQKFGPIKDGLVLDHLCRQTLCVNPDHLEPVTHQVNILRGVGLASQEAKQTHCKYGHSLADAHLVGKPDRLRRDCRQCRINRNSKRLR